MPTNLGWFSNLPIIRDNPFLRLDFSPLFPADPEEEPMNTPTEMSANKRFNMKFGMYNLDNGRKGSTVKREAQRLMDRYNLAFLLTQESLGYKDDLNELKGIDYITGDSGPSRTDSGILIRNDVPHGPGHVVTLSTTEWPRWNGPGMHHARSAAACRIDGLQAYSIHMPPGGPSQRQKAQQASYRECAHTLKDIARKTDGAPLLFGGDWNCGIHSRETFSPRWIATDTRMRLKGSGIDYPVYRGCRITDLRHVNFGASDHSPVIGRVESK